MIAQIELSEEYIKTLADYFAVLVVIEQNLKAGNAELFGNHKKLLV